MFGADTLIDGRYRLLERIGEGGMGVVWRARHEVLGREVAVKLLHPTLTEDPAALARLVAEARAATALEHPSFCAVHDVGVHEGAPFLVMELLRGESLGEKLRKSGPLPPARAARWMLEVLHALNYAHERGIVHRDLKPENVFLCEDSSASGKEPRAVLLDFGAALFLGDGAERVRLTRTGACVGTPAYMSPEQALGLDDVDPRTDVWAAGVMLFELLSGRLPFEAANYNQLLVAIATRAPTPLCELRPSTPRALCELVDAALTPDKTLRLGSAEEFAQGLEDFLAGRHRKPLARPRRAARSSFAWVAGALSFSLAAGLVAVGYARSRAPVLAHAQSPVRASATRFSERTLAALRQCTVWPRGLPAGSRVELDGQRVSGPFERPCSATLTLRVELASGASWNHTALASEWSSVTFVDPAPPQAPARASATSQVPAAQAPARAVLSRAGRRPAEAEGLARRPDF